MEHCNSIKILMVLKKNGISWYISTDTDQHCLTSFWHLWDSSIAGMPTSQLPISLDSRMRSHLQRLFEQPLPVAQEALFSSYLEDVSPPSPTDTGLPSSATQSPHAATRTDHFIEFMKSPVNNAQAPRVVEADELQWPMSNYFINSSHNTYLTGNQLYSEASAEVYRNVSPQSNPNSLGVLR